MFCLGIDFVHVSSCISAVSMKTVHKTACQRFLNEKKNVYSSSTSLPHPVFLTFNPSYRWSKLLVYLLISGSSSCPSQASCIYPRHLCGPGAAAPGALPAFCARLYSCCVFYRNVQLLLFYRWRIALQRSVTCLRKYRKSAMEQETEFKLCRRVQITGPVFLIITFFL